jgi:protein-tyrosine phosphatase
MRLRLDGGRNFRDLGGYRTADGRRVRTGTLYRSGSPVGLTDADRRRIDALGIRRIIDFRSTEERARESGSWPVGADVHVVEWSYSLDPDDYDGLMRAESTAAELDALMCGFYRKMPYLFAPQYTALFTSLAGGHVPIAFHCVAGKDRTGIAAALLLTALGVPRETVIEDYLVSNAMLSPEKLDRPLHVPPSVFNLVARVERNWLEASFAQIESEDGSVEGFIERRLGVAPDQLRALRDNCLV